MEAELEALAVSAAAVLASAMRAPDWPRTELRFRDCFARAGVRGGFARHLSRDQRLLATGELSGTDLEAAWAHRLRVRLAELAELPGELGTLLDELKPERADAAPAPAHNAISGGMVANAVMAGSIGSVTVNGQAASGGATGTDNWPRAGQLRRLGLGVRPTRRFAGTTALPPYVARDIDDELSVLVRQAAHYGGLVIVTGEPLSGKTSTAWSVLRASVAEDSRVFVADGGTDLRGLPDQLRDRDTAHTHVVWLDDLDGHLAEPGTPGVLARLTHDRVLVLATMRDEAYDRHRFGHHPAARALSVAQTVEVPTEWSEPELARLATVDDTRFVDAVRWRGALGVTEFLALGPELWEEWRRARRAGGRRLGHLLVRAAIDLARHGITEAMPLAALRKVAEEYEEQPRTDEETYDDGLVWALALRAGVAGLLVQGETEGTWRACGTLVADALRAPDFPAADEYVWWAMLQNAQEHSPAKHGELLAAARSALAGRGESGDVGVMQALAEFASAAGDMADAKSWYRRMVEHDPDRALLVGLDLVELGEHTEAAGYLETAAADGSRGAVGQLARMYVDRAAHWLARAAEQGDVQAAATLAHLRSAPGMGPATVKE
ncbi:sel1 repeat family protein [Streptomyces sp. NPDC087300]|uniref:sel1 repeat family protein n=1 Tax=Streptomyces sp. NPDC087300 TaxID=3365780 RepID=UPI0037FE4943